MLKYGLKTIKYNKKNVKNGLKTTKIGRVCEFKVREFKFQTKIKPIKISNSPLIAGDLHRRRGASVGGVHRDAVRSRRFVTGVRGGSSAGVRELHHPRHVSVHDSKTHRKWRGQWKDILHYIKCVLDDWFETFLMSQHFCSAFDVSKAVALSHEGGVFCGKV